MIRNTDVFAIRPKMELSKWTTRGYGLIHINGPPWREQRRFALAALRDLGLGKRTMEDRIAKECEILTHELRKLNGEPMDFRILLNNAVSNIICTLVFGDRFDYDDKNFVRLMDNFNYIATRSGLTAFSLFSVLPDWLTFEWMFPPAVKELIKRRREIEAFCLERVQEHRKFFSDEHEPEDFIHAFMKSAAIAEKPSYFSEAQLLESVFSLFIAGTETTSTTLRWALLLMAQHETVQCKVRQEILALVGKGNVPTLRDRINLPYTEATILEIQRIANLIPLVRRAAEVDSYIGKYLIPEGAYVVINLWAIHRDPDIFENPKEFRPERFIDGDDKLVRSEAVIPFSIGKRACLGESLARMELFMFFTALMATFEFKFPLGVNPFDNDVDRYVGVTSSPLNFNISALPV